MESKTLHSVQTFAKVAKIFSKIAFIFSIVGAVGCIAGIASLAAGAGEIIKLGGVTVHGLVEAGSGMSMAMLYGELGAAAIICIGEIILAGKGVKCFDQELAIGTPFDYNWADSLRKLGISAIVIPLVSTVLAQVYSQVLQQILQESFKISASASAEVGLGIALIFTSLLCKLGAEQKQQNTSVIPEE